MTDVSADLRALERRVATLETSAAVALSDKAHMDQRFDRLDKAIERINGHVRWAVMLLVGGILGGIVKFAMDGGFAGV